VFTGIVEAVGVVERLEAQAGGARLWIREPALARAVGRGGSVAVQGACLTRVESPDCSEGVLVFDVVEETLERTALGELRPGAHVNLERALRADGRLEGHLVQGHVDETGRVQELRRQREGVRLFVRTSPGFAGLLVEKGSISIDGVSLTLVGVGAEGFDVALIPHTLAATTLGEREVGDRVNLEADVLGKYVKRYLERGVLAPGHGAART